MKKKWPSIENAVCVQRSSYHYISQDEKYKGVFLIRLDLMLSAAVDTRTVDYHLLLSFLETHSSYWVLSK